MNPSYQAIFNRTGEQKKLAPLLARGGEGEIYPLADRHEVLVKCYHPQILTKQSATLERKIKAMLTVKAQFKSPNMSWPLLDVFDAKGAWLGYAMHRVDGIRMHCLAHAILYQKYFPTLNRRDMVCMLINLVEQVQQLHAQQVMIGDYNLNNFICDPKTLKVSLIDCDSYQITLGQERFPCPVGSPDLTPLEHHGQSYSNVIRTPESESFSLAIILFKCLMLGRHPYDIRGGEDPVSNLRAGNFPYGTGRHGIPTGPWYNIWSHMPHRIKSMFIKTFCEGATDPSKRTTLAQWHEGLTLYLKEIDKNWHELAIRPAQPKQSVHRGSSSRDRS